MTWLDDAEADYPYRGMPFVSGIFAVLARELFAGKLARRADIITEVTEFHFGHGGLPGRQAVIPIAKKALAAMASAGQVENVEGAYGMWRFASMAGEETEDTYDPDDSDPDADAALEAQLLLAAPHCIYVYDYPTYAEHAALRGNDRWPHKIGFTRLTAEARIADQVGTALPENPRIVLSHPSPNAPLLERAIHSALELRGHRIFDVPGTEWFNTNPIEIQSLIDFLIGRPPDEEHARPLG